MDSKVAEIISAGTELLLGEIIDTNAVFLAQKLRDLGIFLFFKSTVGDNRERLAETIKRAFNRCDVVITTGGLGPTEDDLTREAISDVMGETPTENTELIRKLSELFSSRKRPMPEINRKQAWLIPSAVPLENPIGTACGWYIEKGGKTIIALPGPPHEMEKMWNERVVPRLPKPSSCIYYTTFHALGLGEGNIAQLLKEFTSISNPSVATYARVHGVDVRIAANSSSIETARELAFPVERQVYSLIRDYIYGRDGDSIGQVIGRLLTDKSQTIGVIESLTGGLISDLITDTPGASNFFCGSAIAYLNRVKVELGVRETTINQFGVVSKEVAVEMAHCARETFRCDWGISTTGVAGPADVDGIPVGTAYIAIEGPSGIFSKEISWPGERRQIKERVANSALMLLFKTLKKSDK